jgi:RimJ/RimL family protein N-acetyltransferase
LFLVVGYWLFVQDNEAVEKDMTRIETERLILRDFKSDDLQDYHQQIYSDADVTRYLPGGEPRPIERTRYVLEYSVEHGQKHGFTFWAVVNKATHAFMGHCGLVYLEEAPDVELAYAFGKAFWGQGIASEAAQACLRFGFETAGLEQILALAEPENIASQRVMQKIGMQHQGTTERFYNHTLVLYQLNRADWTAGDQFYQLDTTG